MVQMNQSLFSMCTIDHIEYIIFLLLIPLPFMLSLLLGVLIKNVSCKVHFGQHILMLQRKISHMWFSLNFLHFRLEKK